MKFDLQQCKKFFKDHYDYNPPLGWAVYNSPQSLVLPSVSEYNKADLLEPLDRFNTPAWFYLVKLSKAKMKERWRCNWNGNSFCGPGMLFREAAVVSKTPCEEHTNSDGRYHRENGPAILFEDGLAVWCLNGIDCGRYYVETPADKIDPRHVLSEKNVDIRAQLIRKIGIAKVFKFLRPRTIDKDGNGYELLAIDVNGIFNAMYLKMVNPSTGEIHLEGVDRSCITIHQALIWRNSSFTTVPEVIT